MNTRYQLIFIGGTNSLMTNIHKTFFSRCDDLGLDRSYITVLNDENFHEIYKANCPSVCIYFGNNAPHKNHDIVNVLLKDAVFILPTVSDLSAFSKLIPKALRKINGFKLQDKLDVEPIVGSLLEGLSLLRVSRRLFISYRRVESRTVAIQLYEHLDQCGFDVFLDTHSIRPGDSFQDELWHRLIDTDVVVLLNTPGFLESEWTEQELARASAMSIGIIQLVWPNHKPEDYSAFCYPTHLRKKDFQNNDTSSRKAVLKQTTLKRLGSQIESLRARNLSARQDNLIQEFTSAATKLNKKVSLQPQKFLRFTKKNGKTAAIIPAVGIPQAFTFNEAENLLKKIGDGSSTAYLLYDHLYIKEKWQAHLSWLDHHLQIKGIRIREIDSWISKQ